MDNIVLPDEWYSYYYIYSKYNKYFEFKKLVGRQRP